MKQILIVLALVLSSLASADSTLIFQTRNYWNYEVHPEFQINRSLGRAWVNVVLSEYSGDSTNYLDNRVLIEGMSFNEANKTIVIEKNGEEIVCGTLYNRRWVLDFGGSIRSSKRCTFTVKRVKVTEDNGFETYKVPMLQVYLNVQ